MKFYEILSKYYDELFPVSDEKVKQIKNLINITNKTILDIGCSTGELAIKLAREANQITGIDLDKEMIRLARNKATTKSGIDFQEMNMLDIDKLQGKYDVILCLGNTLSHLNSLESVSNFINNSYKKLNINGQLLIQIVNYGNILKENKIIFSPKETQHLVFNRIYSIKEKSRINFHMELTTKANNKKFESDNNLLAILKKDLEPILNQVGFKKFNFYGNYQKSPYSKNSSGLIITAIK